MAAPFSRRATVRPQDRRADGEMRVVAGRKRESFGSSGTNIQDQLRVFPRLELAAVDVERAPAYVTEQDIVITHDELPVVEAHRQASVATTTRLEEHHEPTVLHNLGNGSECRRGGHNSEPFQSLAHIALASRRNQGVSCCS